VVGDRSATVISAGDSGGLPAPLEEAPLGYARAREEELHRPGGTRASGLLGSNTPCEWNQEHILKKTGKGGPLEAWVLLRRRF
jgi:hypothetical protein